MLINRAHIVQHDVVFVVFLPVVFVSLPQVSTCLQEHIIVQCFVRMNIFTLPNKEPPTLQFVFIPLAAATHSVTEVVRLRWSTEVLEMYHQNTCKAWIMRTMYH